MDFLGEVDSMSEYSMIFVVYAEEMKRKICHNWNLIIHPDRIPDPSTTTQSF